MSCTCAGVLCVCVCARTGHEFHMADARGGRARARTRALHARVFKPRQGVLCVKYSPYGSAGVHPREMCMKLRNMI